MLEESLVTATSPLAGICDRPQVLSDMSVQYEPLGVHRRRNPNVSAEILGGFVSGCEGGPGTRYCVVSERSFCNGESRYAIVTLDGTVLLVDHNSDKSPLDSIMWNLQVDHQLMCLSKGTVSIVSQDRLTEV